MSDEGAWTTDIWPLLRKFTRARIGIPRFGDAIPTQDLLRLQLDHAHARDAVLGMVDFALIAARLEDERTVLRVRSAATDRATYIRRPDLGRRLDIASRSRLAQHSASQQYDIVFVIADGLSSKAVEDHAVAVLEACLQRLPSLTVAPIVLAEQARVALGDEICELLNATVCVVLIGERPGLSVANSLGIYLTWRPTIGHRDADRNCLSNIHTDGLGYDQAADKLCWLVSEARQLQLTGIALKENAETKTYVRHDRAKIQLGADQAE